MNSTLKGALIGLASGLSVAIGGAIKDAPYEGFDWVKFARSPAIALVEGATLGHFVPQLTQGYYPIVFYFTIIGTERVTTEGYKLIEPKFR